MTDQMQATVMRGYLFRLYPSPAQAVVLREQAAMCVDLWNAMLQRQEDVYRRTRGQNGVMHDEGKSRLSFFDMTAEITKLRHECPEWAMLSVWTAHRVAKSLDGAFKSFFQRAKEGAGRSSGYPRYRPRRFANAVPHRFASGCSLLPTGRERSRGGGERVSARTWRLKLKGVPGTIRARGEFPAAPQGWAHADVIFRDGAWRLSACVKLAPRRVPGADAIRIRLDLIDCFARVERAEGRRSAPDGSARAVAESPKHLNIVAGGPVADEVAASDERGCVPCRPAGLNLLPVADEVAASDELVRRADAIKSARDRRWPERIRVCDRSRRWWRETRRAARLTGKAARVRREALHRWTTAVVASADYLTIVTLPVRAMTASPRGDTKNWGAAVATVSALNRNTLNQAPAMCAQMLAYKAAEAGIRCDVVIDNAPAVAVGPDLVVGGKLNRRAKRALKKEAA